MNSGLSFFKIISCSQKLRLPPESVARLQGITDGKVIIRDVYNNSWAVEMERDGDDLWFKKGWPQFYEENFLEPKDFMVFHYMGGNLFDFKLFGHDACEKKGAGGPRVIVKEEVEEFIAEEEEDGDEESAEDWMTKKAYKGKSVCGRSKDLSRIYTSHQKKGVEEDAYEEEWADNDYNEDGDEEEDEDEDEEWAESECEEDGRDTKSSKKSIKKNVVDWYGAEIFKSGVAIQPKNPYFVSRTRKLRDNELYIPKDVIAEQKLKIPAKLIMIDGSGRKWEDEARFWKDGRVWLSRGWKGLCRANNISVDDACICEFVQPELPHSILYMLVHPLPPPASS